MAAGVIGQWGIVIGAFTGALIGAIVAVIEIVIIRRR